LQSCGEGASNDLVRPGSVIQLNRPFRERTEERGVIDFLKRVTPLVARRHLTNEQEHWRRVLTRRVHADACVRGARSTRHHADPGPPGQLAMRFGHVRRARFHAARNDLNFVADVVQRVEDRKITLAWHAEHAINTMRHERIDDLTGAGATHGNLLGRCAGTCGRLILPGHHVAAPLHASRSALPLCIVEVF